MRIKIFFLIIMAGISTVMAEGVCKFKTLAAAREFGWRAKKTQKGYTKLELDTQTHAVKSVGVQQMGRYGGLVLLREIVLPALQPNDAIEFEIKQNIGPSLRLNIMGEKGSHKYRSFKAVPGKWSKIRLNFKLAEWQNPSGTSWSNLTRLAWVAPNFQNDKQYLMLRNLKLIVGGKELNLHGLDIKISTWRFPANNDKACFLSTPLAAWIIDKSNGQLVGCYDRLSKKQCLKYAKSIYHYQTAQKEITATEQDDQVVKVEFDSAKNSLKLQCQNPQLPGVIIFKYYRILGRRLQKELNFSSVNATDSFVTLNTELKFNPVYRNNSYYLGAGFIGPLVPTTYIRTRSKVTMFRMTSKGMVLSHSDSQPSFAHYRTKVAERFTFPWWSKFCEKNDCLYYTPNGWEISLGTDKFNRNLLAKFTEEFTLFKGNWFTFLRKIYPEVPEVAAEFKKIPPVPAWVGNIKAFTGFSSMQALKRLVQATDEGYILVLISHVTGPWVDYQVNESAVGPFGGRISGPELKRIISEIKKLSPRIKVGIYNWMNSASWSSRIYRQHPEWFNKENKSGADVDLFPGCASNYASMINNPGLYREIMRQFDLMFSYLNADIIYLDGNKTVNRINWKNGQVVRDDHFYDLWLDIKKLAQRYGKDKVVFLNGRGNPYGDINFIEARHEMRAGAWRQFVGIALGIEAFLNNLPDARIIPLYWHKKMSRDYVNRVLALGWIPSLTYGDPVQKIAFARAAYEVGNVNIVDGHYSPDWKQDDKTTLESYLVQRPGESGYLLSLLSHEPEIRQWQLEIDLQSLPDLAGKTLSVWSYKIADAAVYHGYTSEAYCRKVYKSHNQRLDLVATPKLLYQGRPTGKKLKLNVELKPNQLCMLQLGSSAAGVFSVDNLPNNFMFSNSRGVSVSGEFNPGNKTISVKVDSGKKEAEIIIFPPPSWNCKTVLLDGKKIPFRSVTIGQQIFPLVKVPQGTHRLMLSGGGSRDNAHITVMSTARPAVKPDLKIASYHIKKQIPGMNKIISVNKVIAGIKVLQAAAQTSATQDDLIQTGKPALTASFKLDKLEITAGTTPKVQNFLGAAFAGFEFENVKKIRLRLNNSFYNNFSLRSRIFHTHPFKSSNREFAGFMVDYHSARGWSRRVALGCGVIKAKLNCTYPKYGKGGIPDKVVDLGALIEQGKNRTLALNLTKYAPTDWDGKVWFSVGTVNVAPDRRLDAKILAFNDAVKEPCLSGIDPNDFQKLYFCPKTLTIPRATFTPLIDGLMDEETWKEAALLKDFYLLGAKGIPKAGTAARVFYDDKNIYLGIRCMENVRKSPQISGGAIWNDDEVEVYLDCNNDKKSFFQIIVNAKGEKMELKDGAACKLETKAMATFSKGNGWTVEMAIPYAKLNVPAPVKGTQWRFNICRYRPKGKGFEAELITWAPLEKRFNEPKNFGKVLFK